jgi:hypothetical protein
MSDELRGRIFTADDPGARFCKDCEYHEAGSVWGGGYQFCRYFVDPVLASPRIADFMRTSDGPCGPEAKFFKPLPKQMSWREAFSVVYPKSAKLLGWGK